MGRVFALLLLFLGFIFQGGCVAMFSGTSDSVVIETTPAGKQFKYADAFYESGDRLSISKDIDGAFIMAGKDFGTKLEIPHTADAWIVGDCLLLLLLIIPGVIALCVDAGSGSWRAYELEKPIVIAVPGGTPNIGEKVSKKKKTETIKKNEKK